MDPDQLIDGSTHPLGLIFLVLAAILTWTTPRRLALLPLLLVTCYLPLGQFFELGGLRLSFYRIILLVAAARMVFRGENRGLRMTTLDRVFIAWVLVSFFLGLLTQPSSFESRLVSRMGETYNAVGAYFVARCCLRDLDDFAANLRALGLLLIPLAAAMTHERLTGFNLFSVFGGVPEQTPMRNGVVRSQGAFRHAILAGTYGAFLFPLFYGLYRGSRSGRASAIAGLACTFVVCFTSASSGAILALGAAILGLAAWSVRRFMRVIRFGLALGLVGLALTMNAPVWYIFARISDLAGGTGWYRSFLLEQATTHFHEWFLVGSLYTAHWAPGGETAPNDPNNTDIVNHYVWEGLQGGVLKLVLFIGLIVVGFRLVGRHVASTSDRPLNQRYFAWTLGVCLFTHVISFLSVTYFDQIIVMWYVTLAAIAAAALADLPTPTAARPAATGPGPDTSDPVPAPHAATGP